MSATETFSCFVINAFISFLVLLQSGALVRPVPKMFGVHRELNAFGFGAKI